MVVFLTAMTFISTLAGGLVGLKYRDKLHLILGFTAGVLLGVVAFDILPEIIRLVGETATPEVNPMVALVVGFMVFHILEKLLLIHHAEEENYGQHHHPTVGVLSALALSGHSFLDGVGIGLAFQVSPVIGLVIAIAVIAHDFSDGLNTVSLVLVNRNTDRRAVGLLFLDAVAPVLGVLSTLLFRLPENFLILYLGFFAGFLLYIGASDILPQAHSSKSSIKTIIMTVAGVTFIFLVTRAG